MVTTASFGIVSLNMWVICLRITYCEEMLQLMHLDGQRKGGRSWYLGRQKDKQHELEEQERSNKW